MRRGRALAPHQESRPDASRESVLTLEEAGSTPILREYRAVKAAHPDAVVLARLGDFFELFGDDAELAAPILGVTLTGRGFGSAGRLPMCGVPAHAVIGYIGRLLAAGHRVVLWDQVEDASAAKGLVRREVTRILTPGTVLDDAFLDAAVAIRCVALLPAAGRVGLAAFEAQSGEMQLGELPGGLDSAELAEECERLGAAELLLPEEADVPDTLAPRATRTRLPAAHYATRRGAERLLEVTGTASLRGLGIESLSAAHGAAGALLSYCERSRLVLDAGFVRVRARTQSSVMSLDPQTRRNLELVGAVSGEGSGLVGLLDHTRTPMGARLLRARLLEPLLELGGIEARLDAVAALVGDREVRDRLRNALAEIRDLERLVGRCVQRLASPRDLGAIAAACAALPRVAASAGALRTTATYAPRLVAPDGLTERLRATLVEDPPATSRDGGAIRAGVDADLDALRDAGSDARNFIASLEARERTRTGIRSLKVGYNRVFGYYLEVPNAHRDAVPDDYHRKQTLVGAERYITPVLKEQEGLVLGARERSLAREQELLAALCAEVAAGAAVLLDASRAAGELDVAQSLATTADQRGWCRPEVDGSLTLEIEAGRHPLVEAAIAAGAFVPNDCALAGRAGTSLHDVAGAAQVMVITGPNMAGKSTYLRQVALITLLAQVGSFVPARCARIGVCDRIFTRVGAHDDVTSGLSTFMVEMTETAAILNAATQRSLVILDEIGRGTSTYDGLSIAQAVIEHLHEAPHLGCRTLFATHYHELTTLAERLPGVHNARVEVVEEGETITFLHRIVEGGADRSYGIHVARLAGIPGSVVTRARALLAEHESRQPLESGGAPSRQMALPLVAESMHPVVEELGRLDLDGLTPLEALNKLAQWRDRVRRS